MKLEHLNEYLFAKHSIVPGTQKSSIEDISRDHIGLHAARIMTPYTTLASRLENYNPQMLMDQLYKDRNLTKLRAMRTTLHIAPHDIADMMHTATLGIRTAGSKSFFNKNDITLEQINGIWQQIRPQLAELNTGRDLESLIASHIAKSGDDPAIAKQVLKYLWETGELSYVNAATDWEKEDRRYAVTSDYYPDLKLGGLSQDEARERLAREYIKRFGPATAKDFGWWSGLGAGGFNNLVQQGGGYEKVKCDNSELEFYIEAGEVDRLMGYQPRQDNWVAMTAFEDPSLKGYKESRGRYVSPENYDKLFNKIGEVRAGIIHNGQAIGTWTWDKKSKQVVVDFFTQPPQEIQQQVMELKQKYDAILGMQNQSGEQLTLEQGGI